MGETVHSSDGPGLLKRKQSALTPKVMSSCQPVCFPRCAAQQSGVGVDCLRLRLARVSQCLGHRDLLPREPRLRCLFLGLPENSPVYTDPSENEIQSDFEEVASSSTISWIASLITTNGKCLSHCEQAEEKRIDAPCHGNGAHRFFPWRRSQNRFKVGRFDVC